jgi:hypothetical protein
MNTLVPVRSEVVPLEQQSAIAPAEEPVDLDTELDRLDATLATLDELSARQREFPRHIAEIDAKLAKLAAEDLSTLEALESRQAQQGKYANMKHLAQGQAKKLEAAIRAQEARPREPDSGSYRKSTPVQNWEAGPQASG